MAIKTGLECHQVESSDAASADMSLFRLVRCRLSVEERKDDCASERLERRELRRRGRFGEDGRTPSANVDARFSILWRRREGIWEPVASPFDGAPSMIRYQCTEEATFACSLLTATWTPRRRRSAVRVVQSVAVDGP